MGINGGTGIVGSGATLGGSGIHINRGGGGGFDPAASAIISQMTTNGSTPTEARQVIINQLVLDLKGLGNTGAVDIWSQLDILQIYAAEDDIQAKTEWIRANGTLDAIELNAPTFTSDLGYVSSFSRGLNTSYNPNTDATNYTLNNNAFGVFVEVGTSAAYICGSNSSAVSGSAIRNLTSNNDQTNNSPHLWVDSFAALTGLQTNSRSDANTVALYNNASTKNGNKSRTVSVIPNFEFYVLARNLGNALNGSAFGTTASMFYAGANITENITQFYNSLNTYRTSIGL